MSWAVGYDTNWRRDIGYGVPAICDHPQCRAEIDRGLSYVCGSEPYGGDRGCGLYFCGKHLAYAGYRDAVLLCARCRYRKSPFAAKPDVDRWMRHKLTDPSWAEWRAENPAAVLELASSVATYPSAFVTFPIHQRAMGARTL